MEHYTVTGMSCAACSARVEKAVSEVPGVTRLLGQPADQFHGRGRHSHAAMRSSRLCRQAGYGASQKGAGTDRSPAPS